MPKQRYIGKRFFSPDGHHVMDLQQGRWIKGAGDPPQDLGAGDPPQDFWWDLIQDDEWGFQSPTWVLYECFGEYMKLDRKASSIMKWMVNHV